MNNYDNYVDKNSINNDLSDDIDMKDLTYQLPESQNSIEDDNYIDINLDNNMSTFDFSQLSNSIQEEVKITVNESKTLTIERGKRLKRIRLEYLRMPISKLANSIGIHMMNLRRLEAGRTIIKSRIAEFLCIKFLERGLYVQYQWLMHGLGLEPQVLNNNHNMNELMQNQEYNQLTSLFIEVDKCKKNPVSYEQYRNLSDSFISKVMNILYGQSYISCVINDKRMAPTYNKGMKIFGYWQNFDSRNYNSLNGMDYIVKRENNILMVRKVFYHEQNNYFILTCHNINYKPEVVSVDTPLAHIILSLNYDKNN